MTIICEMMVSDYIPMIRAAASEKLVKHYGYTQSQTASALGISQPAVHKYMNRMSKIKLEKDLQAEVAKMGERLADDIVRGGLPDAELADLCKICNLRNSRLTVCELNKKFAEKTQGTQ